VNISELPQRLACARHWGGVVSIKRRKEIMGSKLPSGRHHLSKNENNGTPPS
jgi:hypothetical protein